MNKENFICFMLVIAFMMGIGVFMLWPRKTTEEPERYRLARERAGRSMLLDQIELAREERDVRDRQ